MMFFANYDSLQAWLAGAMVDEIAEALLDAWDDDRIEEFIDELDRLIAAHPEQ
jgi:hypothetical protein